MKEFAKQLGYNYSVMSTMMNGKRAYDDRVYELIQKHYGLDVNSLNMDGIVPFSKQLTNILHEDKNVIIVQERNNAYVGMNNNNLAGILYIPISRQIEFAQKYKPDNQQFMNTLQRIDIANVPFNGDNYFYFEVNGEGMAPTLMHRDIVIAEKVPDIENANDGFIYVVQTETEIMYKRVIKDGDDMVLASDKPGYKQRRVNKDKIVNLFMVVSSFKLTPPEPITDIKIEV